MTTLSDCHFTQLRYGTAYDRGDVRLYLRRVAFNKTGTYQWDTLARLMSDQVDFISSGYLARFLLCSIVDAPERKLDLFSESSGDSLFSELRSLYRSLENQPVRDYLLSREAKILFQAFNHSLVAAEIHESHFGLDLVYAKIESYAARLALWLHIVNAVVVGEQPAPIISGETMQAAIELAAFYLWQHKLIYAHNAPTQKLDGILLKAQTCALKLWAQGKPLTSSFAKTRINSLKSWATAKIRDKVFRVLALAGFGRTEGQGEKLVYIPNDFSPPPSSPSPRDDIFTLGGVGGVGAGLVTLSTPVSPTPQGINQIAGDDVALVASQISSSPESVASPQFVPVLQTVSSPDAPGALQLVTSVAPDSSPETASPLDTPGSLQADTFVVPDSSPETATPLLQTTNVTNVEPQVPSSSELQPVDNPPTPSPTLGELRAILLACSNLACGNFSRVLSLRTSHKNLFKQAYVSLSPEEQSRFDGFLAASYTDSTESIYKYLGPDSNQPEGYSLLKGDLVRLRDSKLRPNLVWVLPLHAPVVLPGFHPPQFTGVNPKYLQPVQKLYPPSSAADQMSLL